jgi:predicted GIY-YIG superfamily endonuclease
MIKIGIYKITNIINNKSYIGQSININQRFYRHKSALKKGKHYNNYLLASYNKYGLESFTFDILFLLENNSLSKEEILNILNQKEKEFILQYDSFLNGYNLTTGGDSCIVSDETKKKLSESHKGFKLSQERIDKLVNSRKGKKDSEETNKKRSDALKGKKKKSYIHKKGYKLKPCSEERKRKIGDAQKGEKNHNFGKKTSEIIKQKCRDSYHGEQCHLAKITDDIALAIKIDLKEGLLFGSEIAKKYNISKYIVSHIKNEKTWKHIKV